MRNLERGFRRVAAVLSVGGVVIGLLAWRYAYVRNEWRVTAEADSWLSYLVVLALWPWVSFFSVRWIVRGFRSN